MGSDLRVCVRDNVHLGFLFLLVLSVLDPGDWNFKLLDSHLKNLVEEHMSERISGFQRKVVKFRFSMIRDVAYYDPEENGESTTEASHKESLTRCCFNEQINRLEEAFSPIVSNSEVPVGEKNKLPVEALLHAAAEELSLTLVPVYRALPLLREVLQCSSIVQHQLRLTPKYDTRHDDAIYGLMQFALQFRGSRVSSRLRFLALDETVLSVLAILSRDLNAPPFSSLFRLFTESLISSLQDLWPTHSTNGVRLLCACLFYGCTNHCKPKTTKPVLSLMYHYILCHRPLVGSVTTGAEDHWEDSALIVLVSFIYLLASSHGQSYARGFYELVPDIEDIVVSKADSSRRVLEQHTHFGLASLLSGARRFAHWLRCEDRYDGGYSALLLSPDAVGAFSQYSETGMLDPGWKLQLQQAIGGPELVARLLESWSDSLG